MLVLLLLCFGLAYAIRGAMKEAGSQGRAAAGRAGSAAAGRARTARSAAADRMRDSNSRTARGALWAGTALGHGSRAGVAGARAAGRGARDTGRALATGARRGWREGTERAGRRAARQRVATRQRRFNRLRQEAEGRRRARSPWPTASERDPGQGVRDGESASPLAGESESETTVRDPGESPGETGESASERTGENERDIPPPPRWAHLEREDETPGPRDSASDPLRPLDTAVEGGDGSAASSDPNHPEPTPLNGHTGHPVIEGEIVTTAIGSGESTGIAQTRRNLEVFNQASSAHLDTAARASQEASALRAAAAQMQADLAAADVDQSTQATIAALQEQANRLEEAAAGLATAADGMSGASSAALASVNTHSGVEEAVNAHEHAAQTGWYRNNR